jgi:hypothetical protein
MEESRRFPGIKPLSWFAALQGGKLDRGNGRDAAIRRNSNLLF